MTNILLMNKENCALKLVDEIILYYDARAKKHQITICQFHQQVLMNTVDVLTVSVMINAL